MSILCLEPSMEPSAWRFIIYKPFDERMEVDFEIIKDPHSWLADPDLPSQIRWSGNDHSIANGAAYGLLEIFNLFLRISHGREHLSDM